MKKLLSILLLLVVSVAYAQTPGDKDTFDKARDKERQGMNSQKMQKFSPEEFKQKENKFIKHEVKLTETELAFVCPLVHQMNDEIREIDHKVRDISFSTIKEEKTDTECQKAMDDINKLMLEKVNIVKRYQKKMLKELSASKVIHVLNANERFGRYMLRQMMQNLPPRKKPQDNKKSET